MPAGQPGYLDAVSESEEPDADLGRRPDGVSDETVEADLLLGELVGRNVPYGRWTFHVVEEMKEKRRSTGRSGHEGRP